MRQKIFFIAIAFLSICLIGSKCKKDRSDFNGLPPATQEGKNTLGFLLNGKPWTPKGFSGTGNLSVDIDEGFKDGILGIVAYRTEAGKKTQFILGITDSLKFMKAPFDLIISKNSLGGLSFSTENYCDLLHVDENIYQTGKIRITRLDRTNKIVSGLFYGSLFNRDCGDTINISEGRFDIKY